MAFVLFYFYFQLCGYRKEWPLYTKSGYVFFSSAIIDPVSREIFKRERERHVGTCVYYLEIARNAPKVGYEKEIKETSYGTLSAYPMLLSQLKREFAKSVVVNSRKK